ncbi:CpaD family pilus assembly protein [Roseospira visakhapatnamensis]|uniref:Pilus assembly protein CpaD n=1 Tax=Roseospira visakhapatnamensis TaxID=390880 RepID=A0A7W6RFY0_9PROT|nr:CpaD family pilus assembly lipoprotein [Roseospira visakhapatnamensis]MBB4267567.1 pilus assembly protein CpaD [Roseospira visakhapatnamensis]
MALVGACHNPGDIRSDNPYQVSVEKKTFRTEVPMPRVVHQDGRRRVALPRGFLADYQRRGRSPMRIMPPPSRTAEDIEAVRALERWLGDQGIPTEVLDPATAYDYVPPMAGHVGLAFRAYAAVVPVCGDWSGEAGFNPTGLPHTNFGCAVNRNIGLMLSDPGDLERARTAAGYDAGRITVILDKYRQGEVTGTKQPELEEGTASEVAE